MCKFNNRIYLKIDSWITD